MIIIYKNNYHDLRLFHYVTQFRTMKLKEDWGISKVIKANNIILLL